MHSQVYLLAAPASASSLLVFRTHLGLLNGAVLALLFPVTDAYSLPGEVVKLILIMVTDMKMESCTVTRNVDFPHCSNISHTVQPLLDPTCGDAARSFSS